MNSDLPDAGHGAAATEVQARLAAVRARRIADEQQAARLTLLLLAITVARAERDSGRSPHHRAQRAYLDQIWTDTEAVAVAWARLSVSAALQRGASDPVLRQTRRALDVGLQALAAVAEAVNTP